MNSRDVKPGLSTMLLPFHVCICLLVFSGVCGDPGCADENEHEGGAAGQVVQDRQERPPAGQRASAH